MSAHVAEAARVIAAYLEALADRTNARDVYRERFVAAVESLFSDSREARIEAEAVTDAEYLSAHKAYAASLGATTPGNYAKALRVRTSSEHDIALRSALEAARKARASNGSGEADAQVRLVCRETDMAKPLAEVVADAIRDAYAAGQRAAFGVSAPQPAPDRVSRIEAALDTLFAAVGLAPDAMDSAWIAAAKAWNREGE